MITSGRTFWEGGIANPLTAIEQITYLIFMKRLDDLEAKRERDAEFTGEKYVSRFAGKFNVPGSNESIDKNELRWSVFKHKPTNVAACANETLEECLNLES